MNLVDKTVANAFEVCAVIAETLPLDLETHKYASRSERVLIKIVEAGVRGAIAEAIRAEGRRTVAAVLQPPKEPL